MDRSRRVNLVVALLSALLSFVALELLARLWLQRYASHAQLALYATFDELQASRQLLFARHHYLQFAPSPNYQQGANRHNALGFRGDEIAIPKPPGVFRIALVGGSTTYQSEVADYTKTYPYLLQQKLNAQGYGPVEVINAGVQAYASWESLINLAFRVLDVEPDLVLLYDGLNDVHARLVHPWSAYRGDNSGAREPYGPPQEAWVDTSVLLRIARTRLGWRRPLGSIGFRRTFEDVPNNWAEEFWRQKRAGSYPNGVFREAPAADMLSHNRPVFFERNLRSMIAVCREHGARVSLMTYAWSQQFPNPRASSQEYGDALREHNRTILDLCRSHGLTCYDHASEMPADPQYWSDGRHVNERGSVVMAELVFQFLTGSGLLVRQPPAGTAPAPN